MLEGVAAALAAGQSRGEDHAVVRQGRGGRAVGGDGSLEGSQDDRAGDPVVSGQAQREPGVVIEPGQDLGAGAVREGVVGEVCLPALVRLVGLEPDVGGPGPLLRLGDH